MTVEEVDEDVLTPVSDASMMTSLSPQITPDDGDDEEDDVTSRLKRGCTRDDET